MSFGEPKPADIIAASADYFGVEVAEMMRRRGSKTVIAARQVAMTVLRRVTGRSLPEIGHLFDRDHSAVLWAIGRCDDDARLARAAEEIERRILSPPTKTIRRHSRPIKPSRTPGCPHDLGLSLPRAAGG